MSRRALRKLQAVAEADAVEAMKATEVNDAEQEEEEEEEDIRSTKVHGGRGGNLFALLASEGLEEEEDEEDDNEEDKEEEEDLKKQQKQKQQQQQQQQQQQTSKSSRRRKKQQKSSAAKSKPSTAPADSSVDEIDQCVQEVEQLLASRQQKSKEPAAASPAAAVAVNSLSKSLRAKSLLAVEHRLLDANQELQRLFGSATGDAGRSPGAGVVSANRRNRGGQLGAQGVGRGLLVTPKPTWPPVVRLGLSMAADEERFKSDSLAAEAAVYKFEHSREYQRAQLLFLEAVDSGHLENLTAILQRNPYHIDTLLQLAEVFRLQEDVSAAADLVERALYASECAFGAGFNVSSGDCRLSFARRENRGLFVALLRHALNLGQRCCHRASLEFCKLLLALCPSADPMGCLLLIDLPCLMSGQENFLLQLSDAWEASRRLSQLPNWAYSVPLCRFRLGQTDAAERQLLDALLLFPGVLLPLLDKLAVSAREEVANCNYFRHAGNESVGVRQLCSLYVQRAGHCWKEPAAVTFIVSAAYKVVQLVTQSPAAEPRIAEYEQRRRLRYQRPPLNVLRHLLLSDVRDSLSDLPASIDPSGLNAYNPLPPADSVCAYQEELERRRQLRQLAQASAIGGESGLFSAFVRSLLPNYDPNAPAAAAAAAGAGAAVEGPDAAGFRLGFGDVLDTVRELLNNLGPPELPVEVQQNPQNQHEDDEAQDQNEQQQQQHQQ